VHIQIFLLNTNKNTHTYVYIYIHILVGGFNPSEKYESLEIIIPNIWKNKKRAKPPISIYIYVYPLSTFKWGYPKWLVYNAKSIYKWMIWGTTISDTSIYIIYIHIPSKMVIFHSYVSLPEGNNHG